MNVVAEVSVFDSRVQEYQAMTTQFARKLAKPVSELRGREGRILAFFRETVAGGVKDTVRFAMASSKGWLFVDVDGGADLGHTKGNFDVVGFENWIRSEPALSRLGYTQLMDLTVANRTADPISLCPEFGQEPIKVPSGAEKSIVTWFHMFDLKFKGNVIGHSDRAFGFSSKFIHVTIVSPPITPGDTYFGLRHKRPTRSKVNLVIGNDKVEKI